MISQNATENVNSSLAKMGYGNHMATALKR